MTTQGSLAEARGRATLEMIRRHESALRRTARRYSICAEDADDAYQRALEIALTKAPTVRPGELIRWTQTVTKHEALAIRRNRERLLGNRSPQPEEQDVDWLALIPSSAAGPGNQVERREAIAQSREALRTLKPAELRALTLLAEGYSYAEISSITGYSATKVNRCLAEGRERLRAFLTRAETGERCREMAPLLSAFSDGELDAKEAEAVREHLRACAGCRAALRSYRAAPGAAAALAPPLLASPSILERAQDALAWLQSRLPGGGGGGGGSSLASAAAGGAPAAGVGAVAKAVAICAGAGGAAACVAAGVAPVPLDLTTGDERPARIERVASSVTTSDASVAGGSPEGAREPSREASRRRPARRSRQSRPAAASTAGAAAAPDEAPAPAPAAAAEPAPPPEAAPPPESVAAPAPQPAPEQNESAGSPAGEFGP